MTAPLNPVSLDDYVNLVVIEVDRRSLSRSVTMPFPVGSTQQRSADDNQHFNPSPSPPSPLGCLHSRACSEGDLMHFLKEDERKSDEKTSNEESGRVRNIQSSRERRNLRRVRRGVTEIIGTNGKPVFSNFADQPCVKPLFHANSRVYISWKIIFSHI